VHTPGRAKAAQGAWQHPLRPLGRAVRRRQALPALERHAGLKDLRRLASLMHACIVVSLCGPGKPGRSGGRRTVHLDGDPPSVAVLRADRAGGDTKTPRSRRALKLAQVAVGALREWRVDQAAERGAAGSHWQGTGRVFTTATGTPLGARHIWKMFQDVCERAGFGRDWTPRDLRHTFVSLLCTPGSTSPLSRYGLATNRSPQRRFTKPTWHSSSKHSTGPPHPPASQAATSPRPAAATCISA
jgi:integrase